MSIVLTSRLDTAAAGPLRQSLKKLVEEGQPIAIDASEVDQIGQACLQVLAAARAAAVARSLAWQVAAPSMAMIEAGQLAALDVLTAA
ncbi:chemotaxis protein CheX [Sphingomonas sp. BE138]|uniref:STAS domain-containing protein n=1 Tax=Sphingomonas sp. BE138 TaxID=2817845 RepID=UPI0028581562|nr:STAS domain-containing protein [Sphingomonas sp. BE138]MDR6786817.1 chemotaxis protein CheX [Sphingomonas sp. BE138]